LQVFILHQASHWVFSERKWLDRVVGEAISIGLQIQSFEAYRVEHVREHHSANHMSERDPTVAFLFDDLGLRPGMAGRESWRRVVCRLLSPLFHLTLLKRRLASNLGPGAGWMHRLVSACYLATILAAAAAIPGGWLVLLTAAVVPLVLLYNVISTLR